MGRAGCSPYDMNKKFVLLALSGLLSLPVFVFAQNPILFPGPPPLTGGVNIYQLIVVVAGMILNALWIIAVAYTIIMFVVAGFKFLNSQGDPNKVNEARDAVIWAVGGIIVI